MPLLFQQLFFINADFFQKYFLLRRCLPVSPEGLRRRYEIALAKVTSLGGRGVIHGVEASAGWKKVGRLVGFLPVVNYFRACFEGGSVEFAAGAVLKFFIDLADKLFNEEIVETVPLLELSEDDFEFLLFIGGVNFWIFYFGRGHLPGLFLHGGRNINIGCC